MKSINPFDNRVIREYSEYSPEKVREIIASVDDAWQRWKTTSFSLRAELMMNAADVLLIEKEACATIITREMGKLFYEATAEVEKCALCCRYYAQNAERMLQDESVQTEFAKSFVTFEPLGVVLAIMPWNFPFWQVWRFIAPGLMAGNAGVLKHASTVTGCALKIEEIVRKAGFPENLFRSLVLSSSAVELVIAHPAVKAVTLTGSEGAGSKVAEAAGRELKKCVLELGGSDPFILLDDADVEKSVRTALKARTLNCGQVCIAAKRFIVVETVKAQFEDLFREIVESMVAGDPFDPGTHVAPMARPDLVEELHAQVEKSIQMGARLVVGGNRLDLPGNFYAPTLLSDVTKGMPVYEEETFGPVAALIPVKDESEAIAKANDTPFGLGASVWTQDLERGERVARQIESGMVFVNEMTMSLPQMPFGGIKRSGFGRELSHYGIKEFVNIKSICIR